MTVTRIVGEIECADENSGNNIDFLSPRQRRESTAEGLKK